MPPPPTADDDPSVPPPASNGHSAGQDPDVQTAVTDAPVLSSATASLSNTHRLLRSLEELRDTLESRVNQLADSVDRLRAQARELGASMEEHRRNQAVAESDLGSHQGAAGDVGVAGVGQGRVEGNPPRPIPIFLAEDEYLPARTGTHTTTSAIAREVSNLSRPITADDINRLLERASQSLVVPPVEEENGGQVARSNRAAARGDISGGDGRLGAAPPEARRNTAEPPRSNSSDPPIESLQRTVTRLRSLRERIGERGSPSASPEATRGAVDARRADRVAANAQRRRSMRDRQDPGESSDRSAPNAHPATNGIANDNADDMSLTLDERFQRLLNMRPRFSERISLTHTGIQNVMPDGDNDWRGSRIGARRSGSVADNGTGNGNLDAEAHLPTSTNRRDREARHRLAHILSRAPSLPVASRRAHEQPGLPATNLEVIRKNGPPLVVCSAASTPAAMSPQQSTPPLPAPTPGDRVEVSAPHSRSNSPLPIDATPPMAPPPRVREPVRRPVIEYDWFITAASVNEWVQASPLLGTTSDGRTDPGNNASALSRGNGTESATRLTRNTRNTAERDAAAPSDESLTRRGQRVMRAVTAAIPAEQGGTRRATTDRTAVRAQTARMHPADDIAHRRSDRSRTERPNTSTVPTTSVITYESAQRALDAAREERIRAHERYIAIQQATRSLLSPRPGGGVIVTSPPRSDLQSERDRFEHLEALQWRARDELVSAQIRESRAVATREWAGSPLREVNPPIVGRDADELDAVPRHDRPARTSIERIFDEAVARSAEREGDGTESAGIRRTIEITSNSVVPHTATDAGPAERRQRGSTAARITAVDMYPPHDSSSSSSANANLPASIDPSSITPFARALAGTAADRAAVTRRLMAAEERLDLAMAELQDQQARHARQAAEHDLGADLDARRQSQERVDRATRQVADAASRARLLIAPEGAALPSAEDLIRQAMESAIRQRDAAERDGDAAGVERLDVGAVSQDAEMPVGDGAGDGDGYVGPRAPVLLRATFARRGASQELSSSTNRPTSTNDDTRSRRASRDRLLAEANALVPQLGRGVVGRIETMQAEAAAEARAPLVPTPTEDLIMTGTLFVPTLRDGDATVVGDEVVVLGGTDSENDTSSEEEEDDSDDDDAHENEDHADESEHDRDDEVRGNQGQGEDDGGEEDEAGSADSSATTAVPPPNAAVGLAIGIDTAQGRPHAAAPRGADLVLHGDGGGSAATAEMKAHVWPVAPIKKVRRHRPYVSLIDL